MATHQANLKDCFELLLRLVPPGSPSREAPADDHEIRSVEQRWGRALPPCVAEVLSLTNGFGPRGGSLLGGPTSRFGSIVDHLDWNPEYQEMGMLPIGTDGCGNLYLLSASDGCAYFHDQGDSGADVTFEAASSGWLFYLQMLVTECAPLDLIQDSELMKAWDPVRAERWARK